jgi:hypothetical protein
MRFSMLLAAAFLTVSVWAYSDEIPNTASKLDPSTRSPLDRITPGILRAHVSFLASDLLRGRGTPSKELDIAAEYIASQFRGAGLKPVGDDGYFQTADWTTFVSDPGEFSCVFKIGEKEIQVGADHVSASVDRGLRLPSAEVVKVDARDPTVVRKLETEQIKGKVILVRMPASSKVAPERKQETVRLRNAFMGRMAELKPALIVDIESDTTSALGLRPNIAAGRSRPRPPMPPFITLHSKRLSDDFDRMSIGPVADTTLSLHVGEPKKRVAKVRNVVGLLQGSDPVLKDSYVILSAHYDHLGVGPQNATGDSIFNGANDDASGTASVIAIASALGSLKDHPKRSILFVAFYGEEFGLVGSTYFTAHPVIPLDQTIAAINLEQVGRTDDSEGPRVSAATVTGYDFSNVGDILRQAGESVGVAVSKHPVFSDRYFSASDNLALAKAGIPAHTISVAYQFPDYHGQDDEWERLDYVNMAKIDRMAALGLITIANDSVAPRWDETNPKTKPYLRQK